MTLIGFIGLISAGSGLVQNPDGSYYFPPLFYFFDILATIGFLVAVVAVIWAFVQALRAKRWGWAVGLILGSALVTFFAAPSLLALVFAVWVPIRRDTPKRLPASGAPDSPPSMAPGIA